MKTFFLAMMCFVLFFSLSVSAMEPSVEEDIQKKEMYSEVGKAWRAQFNITLYGGVCLLMGMKSSKKEVGKKILDFIQKGKDIASVEEKEVTYTELGEIYTKLFNDLEYASDEELGELVFTVLGVQRKLRRTLDVNTGDPVTAMELGSVARGLLSSETDVKELGVLFLEVIKMQIMVEETMKREGMKREAPKKEKIGNGGYEISKNLLAFSIPFGNKKTFEKRFGEACLEFLEEIARAKYYYGVRV